MGEGWWVDEWMGDGWKGGCVDGWVGFSPFYPAEYHKVLTDLSSYPIGPSTTPTFLSSEKDS